MLKREIKAENNEIRRLKNKYDSEYYNGKTGVSPYRGYYLEDHSPYFSAMSKTIIDFFHPTTTLDIGCGKGFLPYFLKKAGVKASGVDISQYALSSSSEEIRGNLLLADVDNISLPFKDCSFDFITILETLEHLYNPELLIRESLRILKPKGLIYVTTPRPGTKSDKGDNTHINVRSRKDWNIIFKLFGLRENRVLLHRFLWKIYKEESMKTLKPTSGTTKLGMILGKFGKGGRWIRGVLKFIYFSYYSHCGFLLTPNQDI